jgi:hypothetical protein
LLRRRDFGLFSMSCIFFAPDELDAALHENVVEAEDEPHQHEHLDHLDGGRHLQAVRYAQESENFSHLTVLQIVVIDSKLLPLEMYHKCTVRESTNTKFCYFEK